MSTNLRHKFINVPDWIATRVARWTDIFNLREWAITVTMAERDKLQQEDLLVGGDRETEAITNTNTPYLNAEMTFGSQLTDTPEFHSTVFHEVRHLYYDQAFAHWVVTKVIDAYVPPHLKRAVATEFQERMEQLIEKDIYQFQQLTDL